MLVKIKFLLCFLVISAIFLFSPKIISAQVVINEFSSATSDDDWVEIYNNSEQSIDLSEYNLIDGSSSGNKKTFSCILAPGGFWVVDWSNKLNNDGDIVRLKKGEDVIVDCVSYGDGAGQKCEGKESVDLEKLNVGESAARSIDGSGSWVKTNNVTKDGPNSGEPRDPSASCFIPTPTPEPTNTPTPTPTPKPPTPTPKPPASTPTPSLSFTPTPTPTPSLRAVGLTATLSGEILGEEESSPEAFYPWEATQEAEEAQEATPSKRRILPFIFLGLGLAFLAAAAYSCYTKLRWPEQGS